MKLLREAEKGISNCLGCDDEEIDSNNGACGDIMSSHFLATSVTVLSTSHVAAN